MGMLLLFLVFLRIRLKTRSKIVVFEDNLMGNKNLSYPSNLEEEPAHISIAATNNYYKNTPVFAEKVLPYGFEVVLLSGGDFSFLGESGDGYF